MSRTQAPERWSSPRLDLRRPEIKDAESIFHRYASDPQVTHYLGWPRHLSVEDSRQFVEFSICEWQRSPAGPYLIYLRSNGQLIGSTGFTFHGPSARSAMTGYVLARDAWGSGYATEALQAMIVIAQELNLLSLTALCHPDHIRSIRVLEKCHFTLSSQQMVPQTFPNLATSPSVAAREYQLLLLDSRSE